MDSKVWRKILGYQVGEKIRLKTSTYATHREGFGKEFFVKKGEIGKIIQIYPRPFHTYFKVRFPKGRILVLFDKEVTIP